MTYSKDVHVDGSISEYYEGTPEEIKELLSIGRQVKPVKIDKNDMAKFIFYRIQEEGGYENIDMIRTVLEMQDEYIAKQESKV